MQFVHPALVFGALLFAVPLIIHLLNRQRFRRRQWAAMEYLLRAFKKQRRRLRTENIILLLLRCLIPVLLALAISRPFFRESKSFLPTAGTTHHILVLDRSYSMGYEPKGGTSPHSRAIRLATKRLEQLEGRQGQKVTLVLAGVRPKIPIRESLSLAGVRARLTSLGPPEDSAESLLPALLEVAELLEEKVALGTGTPDGDVQVQIFTDLQKGCFGEELKEKEKGEAQEPGKAAPGRILDPDEEAAAKRAAKESARELLERIAKLGSLTLMDMGAASGSREDNLQITNLSLEQASAVATRPLEVVASLRNLSETTQTLQVTLEKDGAEPMRKLLRVDAGAETQVSFQVIFREKGLHRLRASITGDGLEADNECHLVVKVEDRLRILMVEGSTELDESLTDSGRLRDILDPTRGEGEVSVSEFSTKVVDFASFMMGREKLSDYHAIVLANVERLNEQVREQLEAAVRAGTGLLVMFGDHVDAESYNQYLHAAGEGPMPFRLLRQEGYEPGGKLAYRSQVMAEDHPVFADFKQEVELQYLQVTPIYRYFDIDRESLAEKRVGPSGQILWELNNAQRSPLLLASRYGEGKTLFLTSAMSRRPKHWNRLDELIVAYPLFHPLIRWLARPATDPHNVLVGATLTALLRHRPSNLAVVLPERAGSAKVPVAREATPVPGGFYSLPPFTRTEYAGIYTFEMDLGQHGQSELLRLPFAANPEPREGELEYLRYEVIRDRLGVKRILKVLPEEDVEIASAGLRELGPLLLYFVLFFVLSEAIWARFVSRRRS